LRNCQMRKNVFFTFLFGLAVVVIKDLNTIHGDYMAMANW